MADSCPTCVLLDALMASRGFTRDERSITSSAPVRSVDRKIKKTTRKVARRTNKALSRAFKEANARLRKKNGDLRKGKSQADVARLAHKIHRGMRR